MSANQAGERNRLDAPRIVAALRGAFARDLEAKEILTIAADRIVATGAPFVAVQIFLLEGESIGWQVSRGKEPISLVQSGVGSITVAADGKLTGAPLTVIVAPV